MLSIFFWLGFSAVIGSVFYFFNGLHNADLGHNLSLINARYNLNLADQNNMFEVMTPSTLYIVGFNQMIIGFFMGLFGMLIFIIGFTGLMTINITK